MLRIAIIGAGRIGAVHAATVAAHPGARLVLIADPVAGAAERLAAPFGARSTLEAADVFADDTVDAVIIGSPTRFHVDHILGAVGAGKAALVEKPVDLDLQRVDECIARVGADASRVMVGFNRRFDAGFAEIRARVDAGEIGQVEQLTIISRDPTPPPAAYIAGSGGIFRDMSIHDFDMARFLLGDIVQVSAVGQNLDADIAAAGDFDAAVTTLRAASGAVATIINSRHSATGYDQRLEAFGPSGSLFAENHTETSVRASTATSSNAAGPFRAFFLDRYADAYRAELGHFIEAVEAGAPLSPTLHDGREALVIADLATASAEAARGDRP